MAVKIENPFKLIASSRKGFLDLDLGCPPNAAGSTSPLADEIEMLVYCRQAKGVSNSSVEIDAEGYFIIHRTNSGFQIGPFRCLLNDVVESPKSILSPI